MDAEGSGFYGSLTDAEREALREAGAVRRFPPNAFLFTEGAHSAHVIVVLSGRLKISSYTKDGKEVVLGVRGPGDLLGELAALDEEPRSASVSTLEPVEALVVTADRFRSFLADNPRIALEIMQMLTSRLREADRRRIEFGAFDTAGRVARTIVELAERFGAEQGEDSVRIDLPLTQEELAGWTGSSREAVAKALKTMRDRGWIETGRKSILILDLDAVRKRAT